VAKDDEEKEATETKAKGGKLKLIIMVLPLLLLIAGAGWFFLLKPSGGADVPKALPPPKPGTVLKIDPITINLAGGVHYLKLGLALQPTADATEVDGSKALDLAITEFTGMSIDELSTAEGRAKAKEELLARIKLAYLPEGTETVETTAAAVPGEKAPAAPKTDPELSASAVIKKAAALTVQTTVYEIYFTEFVYQ
jgi:flagellar FliL protein